jgi:hypothetical protein
MPTQYVLFQVANENGSIRSKDGLTYIRIVGVYRSKQYALNLAKGLDLETRIAPTESFAILLNKKHPHKDDEKEHFERLTRAYADSQKQSGAEREARATEKTCPPVDAALPNHHDVHEAVHEAILEASHEAILEANHEAILEATSSLNSLADDGHSVCVLAIVPDVFHWDRTKQLHERYLEESDKEFAKLPVSATTDTDVQPDREAFFGNWIKGKQTLVPGDQPLVDFLGAFETEADAKKFLDEYPDLKEFPRACVRMRKWIRLCDVHTVDVQRYYDDARLQKFMDALRGAKKKVD